ncbi:glycosyltransferase [Pseudohaliea sp.]|uniref:glycosyltransferase n=1 Tax=Pseudohaliea sp. TaxID=2740289 RepID=UPI0032ED4F3F
MQLSVIICTWNRAESLRRCLARFTEIALPKKGDWEILVVNNNSTDNTSRIVKSFSALLPIREVLEPVQGLSAARNRGVHEARGELLLWTDDDVLVSMNWLLEYASACTRNPSVAFFGGPIEPVFEGSPASWLSEGWRAVEAAFASRDLGSSECRLCPDTLPYGANFAVRRHVQKHFLYDLELGRKGTEMLSGEESAVMTAVLEAGYSGLWLPGASVSHLIEPDRQRIRYLRDYYQGIGALSVRRNQELRLESAGRGQKRRITAIPLWLIRRLFMAECMYLITKRLANPEVWLGHLRVASISRGAVNEMLRPS